jgi:hypothetical protein
MTVGASQYARIEGERYYTPAWVTGALLSVEPISGGVWDPAAGAGDIIKALPPGIPSFGSDIAPDADGIKELDFFDVKIGGEWPIILTNPPYGKGSRLAVRFIEHALDLTRPMGGKVIMLLKVGFDSAGGRRHLFADHPAFAVEYRLTKRIRWTNLPQSDAGPTENHSIFLWDWRKRPGPAVKGYLPLPHSMEATPCFIVPHL